MSQFIQGHALLIGVDRYQDAQLRDVSVVGADVQMIAETLRNPQICGYPEDQVQVLTGTAATHTTILNALSELATRVKPDDTVFLLFSGHGAFGSDGKTYYLVSYDSKVATSNSATHPDQTYIVQGTGISQAELIKHLEAIPAQRLLLFFNACFSGTLSPATLSDEQQPATLGSILPDDTANALLNTGQGRAVITAAREYQYSIIGSGTHTIFAEALNAALCGKDVLNREGAITLFDLYAAVYRHVSEQTPPLVAKFTPKMKQRHRDDRQQPQLTLLKNTGIMTVARYSGDLQPIALGSDAPAEPPIRTIPAETARQAYQHILAGRDMSLTSVGRDQHNPNTTISQSATGSNIAQAGAHSNASVNTHYADPTSLQRISKTQLVRIIATQYIPHHWSTLLFELEDRIDDITAINEPDSLERARALLRLCLRQRQVTVLINALIAAQSDLLGSSAEQQGWLNWAQQQDTRP